MEPHKELFHVDKRLHFIFKKKDFDVLTKCISLLYKLVLDDGLIKNKSGGM